MIPLCLPQSIYWDRRVNAYTLGENINSQGGNKMTFVVTWCGPENSTNQAPNSPSLPVNVDFTVRQYGKNKLRGYFTKKFPQNQDEEIRGNQRYVQSA